MSRPAARLKRDPVAWLGGGALVLLALAALGADVIAPQGPLAGDLDRRLEPPSSAHLFGTDHQGRDVLARTLHGARLSLVLGFGARTLSLVLGGVLGFLAGFRGGRTDFLVMRACDVFFAFPSLLLLVGITAALEPGLGVVFVALGVVGWAEVARLVRGETLSIRERPYVAAARALGLGEARILSRHVAPNCTSVLLVSFSMGVASTILAEAGLSFLGLGAQPPTPSWGQMISAGKESLAAAPWVSFFPGAALALTVLSLNLLGDSVRDALDPRHGGKGTS
jgi:ABC-type dipeptide/oligopeptide/nickel transport system permease subunit